MSEFGEIPQSNALSEADPLSVQELLTRNPFDYVRNGGLAVAVIAEYREYRRRYQEAELLGKTKPKQSKATLSSTSPLSAEELGF